MNIHKQVLTTASLLMIFAIIGAGIVGLTYENTYKRIERNEEQVLLRKLHTILPPGEYDNDLLDDRLIRFAGSVELFSETSGDAEFIGSGDGVL